MIIGYVGIPGSGKSYEAVVRILDNLKTGRSVYTNIDGLDQDQSREHIKLKTGLNDEQLFKQLHFLKTEQIKEFWKIVDSDPGSLIVIDEVHKLFSNRDWASEKNKEFTEWASTHRHGGYDVLLITQDIEKIDKHARSLIEWTYFFRKINHFGKMVNLKYRRYAYDDDNHFGKPISQETLTYDKSVFPCYSSYDSSAVKELGIQKNVNVLKHPVFFAIPCVIAIFVYFLSQSSIMTGDIFGTKAIAGIEEIVKPDILPLNPNYKKAKEINLVVESEKDYKSLIQDPLPGQRTTELVMYRFTDGSIYSTNLKKPSKFPLKTISEIIYF